ncbi:hypothetical protein [Enterobacter phage N5822]|nr:hypothetical protein [Enterobacter phage N5822]
MLSRRKDVFREQKKQLMVLTKRHKWLQCTYTNTQERKNE